MFRSTVPNCVAGTEHLEHLAPRKESSRIGVFRKPEILSRHMLHAPKILRPRRAGSTGGAAKPKDSALASGRRVGLGFRAVLGKGSTLNPINPKPASELFGHAEGESHRCPWAWQGRS